MLATFPIMSFLSRYKSVLAEGDQIQARKVA